MCDFGELGKERKEAANKKRWELYKTERDQNVKNMYKETSKPRDELNQEPI